eukprot:6445290-Alexandrium_andersonii.AAC.1
MPEETLGTKCRTTTLEGLWYSTLVVYVPSSTHPSPGEPNRCPEGPDRAGAEGQSLRAQTPEAVLDHLRPLTTAYSALSGRNWCSSLLRRAQEAFNTIRPSAPARPAVKSPCSPGNCTAKLRKPSVCCFIRCLLQEIMPESDTHGEYSWTIKSSSGAVVEILIRSAVPAFMVKKSAKRELPKHERIRMDAKGSWADTWEY